MGLFPNNLDAFAHGLGLLEPDVGLDVGRAGLAFLELAGMCIAVLSEVGRVVLQVEVWVV